MNIYCQIIYSHPTKNHYDSNIFHEYYQKLGGGLKFPQGTSSSESPPRVSDSIHEKYLSRNDFSSDENI